MKRLSGLILVLFLTIITPAQNPEIAPNENLIVEGVPKIPASLAETVERYTNFRGASLESWDPAKREMLISTRFADTSQMHLVKMPGGARTQLTFYPDSVYAALFSPASDSTFVFSNLHKSRKWICSLVSVAICSPRSGEISSAKAERRIMTGLPLGECEPIHICPE